MKIDLEYSSPTSKTTALLQEMYDKHGFIPRVGDHLRVCQEDYNEWSKEDQKDYDYGLDTVRDVYISFWHDTIFIGIGQK